MSAEMLQDQEFVRLAQEYKFLRRFLSEGLEALTYVIVDIETTGLSPDTHEITEIGALKVQGSEIKDVFSRLIKPKLPIPAEITRLTGIDDEMVKDAPDESEVLLQFLEFIGPDTVLVAHNVDFDLGFIKKHLAFVTEKEIRNLAVCTVKLSKFLLPALANHKLHTVAGHFHFEIANRHRAMGDVELTFQVWSKFIQLLKERHINNRHDLDSLVSRL